MPKRIRKESYLRGESIERSIMFPCCAKAERKLSSTKPVPYTYTVFPLRTPLRSGYESDPEQH